MQVWSSFSNGVNGIHITGGSSGNFFIQPPAPSYYGADVGNNIESNRVNGFLVEGGSRNNVSMTPCLVSLMSRMGFLSPARGHRQSSRPLFGPGANDRDGIRLKRGPR